MPTDCNPWVLFRGSLCDNWGMPRFVLLRHECPPDWEKSSHWDLMLEADGVLWTWELRELPTTWARALGHQSRSASAADSVPATRLADHRLAYLDYEGPVSGGRGTVSRVDGGSCEWNSRTAMRVDAKLGGGLLRGSIRIEGNSLQIIDSPNPA